MVTGPDDVRFQRRTGSSRPTTKITRLTRFRHRVGTTHSITSGVPRLGLPVGGRVLKPVPVADPLSSECDGHRWHSISLQRRPPTNCLSLSCCSPGRSSLSRNDVPVATDRPKDHSLALVARFRVTTAVPPPVAGVGFLYVSSSPLIAMKRF